MEIALAALLVSSLTSVGLLSLWVATSPRHWFLRTAVFGGVLSPLLLIPAYEPVVAFALQSIIVAAGIQIARWFKRTGPAPPRRFSLATLLQVTVVVSVVITVCTKLPTSEFLIWVRAVLIGVGGGVVTLVGCWIAQGRNLRWWLQFGLGLILVVVVSMAIAWLDWHTVKSLSPKFFSPYASSYAVAGILGQLSFVGFTYDYTDALRTWSSWFMSAACLISLLVWLASGTLKEAVSNLPRRRIQNSFAISFLLLLIVQLIPSAVIYYQLMTPLPIPVQVLPSDNGYGDLIAAGQLVVNSSQWLDDFDADLVPIEELRAANVELQPAYEILQNVLSKDIQVPTGYQSTPDIPSPDLHCYSASYCLEIRAILSVRESRYKDAVIDYVDLLEIGFAIRHGALEEGVSTGIDITESGLIGLYQLRKEIDAEQSGQVIRLLLQLVSERESLQEVSYRQAVFLQHAFGWHGHLEEIFEKIKNPDFYLSSSNFYQGLLAREQAFSHLLCTELALMSFRNKQGHFPERLEELVPKYLPVALGDPFSSEGEALKYQREGESYVLYSLGDDDSDENKLFLKSVFGERPEASSFQ